MSENHKTLISIITESILENDLSRDIDQLGAHGYTVFDVRGKGGQGYRHADWSETANIQIEVVCTEDVANAIIAHLEEKYFSDYAMILYTTRVTVLRSEKF